MNSLKLIVKFCAVLFLASSCDVIAKPFDTAKVDSLIFGGYAGMADPHYSLVFKYSTGILQVDTVNSYFFQEASVDPRKYKWVTIGRTDSSLITNLIKSIPTNYGQVDSVFASPDQVDQGGTFVILYHKAGRMKLDLDNYSDQIPYDLRPVLNAIQVTKDSLCKIHQIR